MSSLHVVPLKTCLYVCSDTFLVIYWKLNSIVPAFWLLHSHSKMERKESWSQIFPGSWQSADTGSPCHWAVAAKLLSKTGEQLVFQSPVFESLSNLFQPNYYTINYRRKWFNKSIGILVHCVVNLKVTIPGFVNIKTCCDLMEMHV